MMNQRETAGATQLIRAFGPRLPAISAAAQRGRVGGLLRRSAVATAAPPSATGLDTVYSRPADDTGLAAECEAIRIMGFRGKLAVHPRQVEIINRAFTPDLTEVAAARRLIAVFKAHQRAGRGVCVLDGKMVDMPMFRAAQDLLARAGKGPEGD